MGDLLLHEELNSIAVLTLNRPDRHNSLIPPLLADLSTALVAVAKNNGINAIVLQANGRSFSTGADVLGFYEHLDEIEAYAQEIVGLLNRVMLAMMELPVPIVAAIHGMVTGGSMGLVLAADEVLVTPDTRFVPYYSVVGFSPDGGWSAILPHVIGAKRTANILMHNRTITAEQAVAWGIASRMVRPTQIRMEALQTAQSIASRKSGSIRHTKQLIRRSYGDLASNLETERKLFVRQVASDEARQGILTYLERPKN
jgi:enoyl-CoA hydratase/carnithine racemase